jgi:uncharacterized membrane protein
MSRSRADLAITAAVAVVACAAAAAGAPAAVMTVLGLLLIAAPGYLLGQVLLGPYIAGLERLAVATGLAFCVPILGGLLLYVAGVPLHRTAWLSLLAGVTLICDVVLFLRRRHGPLASAGEGWRVPRGHAVAFAAAVVIAIGAVGIARAGVAMQHYPGYTQLWLDRPNGNARTVNLGVGNYEGATVRYRLVLADNGHTVTRDLALVNGQVWQSSPQYSGRHAITVKLFRLPDVATPYRHVTLAAAGTP